MARVTTQLVALALVIGGLLLLPSGTWTSAQEGNKLQPLDLPAGQSVKDDEDEDDPESIIFYGQEYEADAFFWCVDRSCSMSGGTPNPLQVLKDELQAAVQSLSKRSEFGMVRFSSGFSKYQPLPVKATAAQKANAVAWITSMTAEGMTCLGAAGVATLEIANASRKRNKRMICMADGGANCPGCPSEVPQITNANWQRIPIDTLFVGGSASGVQCMQDLANANGGSFAQIN